MRCGEPHVQFNRSCHAEYFSAKRKSQLRIDGQTLTMTSNMPLPDNNIGIDPQRLEVVVRENAGLENRVAVLPTFIDIRNEVVNYPVQIEGVVEVLAVSRAMGTERHVVKFRLARLCGVGDDCVVGVVIPEDASIEGGQAGEGWLAHFSYGDVRLPISYLLLHPIAL